MPKTKKQTTSKKPSKSFQISTLRALDSRAKFFVFVAVFLIVGAGYFAYKSYAATTVATWTAADSELKVTGVSGSTVAPYIDYNLGSQNKQVKFVYPRDGNTIAGADVSVDMQLQFENAKGVPHKDVQFCIYYKPVTASAETTDVLLKAPFKQNTIGHQPYDPWGQVSTYGYLRNCSTVVISDNGKTANRVTDYRAFVPIGGKAPVTVSYRVLSKQTGRSVDVWKVTRQYHDF